MDPWPRLIIAGTHSGVGKTTVMLGIAAALMRRGITVQAFKTGPDYLDAGHHTQLTGRVCRNLDTWLLSDTRVLAVFQHAAAGAGVSLIEGVMGLFDGHSTTDERGSAAQLAKLLRAPVILVIDGSAMARSVAALVRGYTEFDPDVTIAGVIINRVRDGHYRLLRQALRNSGIPVLGYLPIDETVSLPERHLGLVPPTEFPMTSARRDRLAELAGRSLELAGLQQLAEHAAPLPTAAWPTPRPASSVFPVALGIARDAAFHFYYEENLELLHGAGADLVPFSPQADAQLPEGVSGLYLGGGFPEVFAASLAANAPMRAAIRRAAEAGMPIYGECGGLMYLTEALVDPDGRRLPMAGVLPGTVRMTPRLQSFGYATAIPRRATILAQPHDAIKGHEFHYSVWDHAPRARDAAYTVVRHHQPRRLEGFARGNVLASYIHVHLLSNPRWARGFVASAQHWRAAMPQTR